MSTELGKFSLDRMVRAVEKVRQRLLRAAAALEGAGVAYAVAGGNAIALWVSRVDESAVRNTHEVDILLLREDFEAAKGALCQAGFVHRHSSGFEMFLDGPNAKARDAVHIVFANEKVRPGEIAPSPDVSDFVDSGEFRVLSFSALVRSKLTAFRDKDRTHLRDLIDVGLVDASTADGLPDGLAERLRQLFENPDG
jgi:hypothetical protein